MMNIAVKNKKVNKVHILLIAVENQQYSGFNLCIQSRHYIAQTEKCYSQIC